MKKTTALTMLFLFASCSKNHLKQGVIVDKIYEAAYIQTLPSVDNKTPGTTIVYPEQYFFDITGQYQNKQITERVEVDIHMFENKKAGETYIP